MSDRLPCPFCGSESEALYHGNKWRVVCLECQATSNRFIKRDWAVRSWNRRVSPPPATHKEKESA